MAEGLVTDLIKQLVSIAAQEVEQEIRLVIGVDKEIRRLEGNLQTVKAVLNDAEKRQVTEEAVKVWLGKLNNICYEMEDVMDEWNTELIKSAIQKEEENADNAPVMKKKQVCSFIPSPSCCFSQVDKLARRHDIAHKIKELNGILDEIAKEKDRYQFQLTNDPAPRVVERPQTTSFVDVSEICGRDNVKDDLVSMLLGKGSKEESSLHLISLVGMGGIGKTTLAQLAYNDPKVQVHFEIKVWVCVSDPFDQCKVAKEILESIKVQSSDLTTLQSLLNRICDNVQGRKFFLVLDDVWSEGSTTWEPFRLALKCVAQGSRIIVTTRKSRVAEIMGSVSVINLEVLSKEDCWSMFSKIAFFDRDPKQCEQLEDLARQISNKCKGLPLAAKTLGSLMRFKRSREQWEMVFCSNLWELENVERGLFAPLLLSYYDLPSPLKRCFSYCATFPKDFVISSDELVLMWMAQGYIDSKENMEMEVIAREYFENLAIRSFFQDFEKEKDDDRIMRCKMHDIVHDFAQLLTRNECFIVNSDIKQGSNYKNARHLHLENEAQFPSLYCATNLRTLIVKSITDDNLSPLFQHFRCLRTLTLMFQRDSLESLPDAIENLIHLRCLTLLYYKGDKLPESICNLCNLQSLKIILYGDNFKRFPQGMSKLINLRHLDLDYNMCYISFPRGIGRLIYLRTLNYFKITEMDDSEGCKLEQLKNLNHLQGTLQIRGLQNVVDVHDAENAQLKKKIHLSGLLLFFEGDSDRRMENESLVLNALEPPPNLEDLAINGYEGTMLPNWETSLTKLKKLSLCVLGKLEHLPPLGDLPFLESLTIGSVPRLKKVGVEFLGGIELKNKKEYIIKRFPNLKSLSFSLMSTWEEWTGIEEGMRGGEEKKEDCIITIMPQLQYLNLWDCPNLKSLPDFLRTTPLKTLLIYRCSILKERCKVGTGKDWPKISHVPNIGIDKVMMQRED